MHHKPWFVIQGHEKPSVVLSIAADVLDRMLDLGRPEYVRVA
jgi:hypothetical protein